MVVCEDIYRYLCAYRAIYLYIDLDVDGCCMVRGDLNVNKLEVGRMPIENIKSKDNISSWYYRLMIM